MRPLEGVVVVDVATAVAGPACTQWLRFLGAEVIKVERPGTGDTFRDYHVNVGEDSVSLPFATINAGKQSITVDLKTTAGQDLVRRLAEKADVLVQNYRPGVAERLGLDWRTLSEANPRLVYCNISGFGATGQLSTRPAYDHIVQAMSGVMHLNGNEGDPPLKLGPPVADLLSGITAAVGILGALVKRAEQGTGDRVDVSMLDSLMSILALYITPYLAKGRIPQRLGNHGYRLVATSDIYETSDGMIAFSANHDHQFRTLSETLGLTIHEDPRFRTHSLRSEHGEELADALKVAFASRSAVELEETLGGLGLAAARVRTLPEILDGYFVPERPDVFRTVQVEDEDDLTIMGLPFSYESVVDHPPLRLPTLGEDTDAILKRLGYSDSDIGSLRSEGVLG